MIGMDHMQQPDQPGNFAGSDLKEIGVIPVPFCVTSNGPRASIPFKDSAAASRCSLATWEAASSPLNLLPSELLAKVRLFEDYIIFGIVIIFWVWVWELLSLILQWFELIFLVGRNFESNPNLVYD